MVTRVLRELPAISPIRCERTSPGAELAQASPRHWATARSAGPSAAAGEAVEQAGRGQGDEKRRDSLVGAVHVYLHLLFMYLTV